VYAAKETELRGHAAVKEQLVAEAQALLPVTDWRTAKSQLRGIQERWEQAGPVPRESRDQLEQGLRKVEDAVRKAEDAQWKRSNPEALARAQGAVDQLRANIASLEEQLAKAQARGDEAAARKAEDALSARRSWLTEAEHTLAEFSG
jgi:chromosome segregation ATPase